MLENKIYMETNWLSVKTQQYISTPILIVYRRILKIFK